MKIQCDVCFKEEAAVFCSADEAALCDSCDRRVHHANKVASKHPRFSLLHSPFKDSPRCDICQERRALLFCQQDRAIFCRECDIPIHKANEHTQKHNRFLLTGVKLSASFASYQASSSSIGIDACIESSESETKSLVLTENFIPNSSQKALESTSTSCKPNDNLTSQEGSISTSSISEYLTETLPGWHVEDFLDPLSPHGFCKITDQNMQFMDQDLESTWGSFTTENVGSWVPQFSDFPPCSPQIDVMNWHKESERVNNTKKVTKRPCEYGVRVPQIGSQSIKKSRQFW